MIPNKSYAVTELSADNDTLICCDCREPAHYVVNNLFACCQNHIIEAMKEFDDMYVETDAWIIR